MFKKLKRASPEERMLEERIYDLVAAEMSSGIRRNGLWLKAFSESKGNLQAAQSRYIKLRVESMKDELTTASDIERSDCPTQAAKEEGEKRRDIERIESAKRALADSGCQTTDIPKGWQTVTTFGVVRVSRTIEELEAYVDIMTARRDKYKAS